MSRRPKWVQEEIKIIEVKIKEYETWWSGFLSP